ncbi:MAG: VOC family protein [Thermomicrobiales bacterium]
MNKITPFLWFDNQAEEAMNFYVSVFSNSEVHEVNRYGEGAPQPEGTAMTTSFRLAGQEFAALNGGPVFNFTPAVSFFVDCETEEEIDALWSQLVEGGSVLMPFDKYPFSDKYGWLNDRYGVSWQVMLSGEPQSITPFLTFVGDQNGHAEEAINFSTSLFANSRVEQINRYGPGLGEPEDAVVHARFTLASQPFIAMESSLEHVFSFTEATSFSVRCESQEEVDDLWEKLTDGGEPGQCAWLKDKYGLSWQIVPRALMEMLQDEDPEKSSRVMQAMLKMTKIDIAELRRAYDQPSVAATS